MAITKVSQHLLADDLVLPGNPTVATQSASDNSTKIATTAYVTTAVSNLVDGAPSTLNTLNEIAAALGDDAALNTTLTNSIAAKLPLAGGTMTGNIIMGDDTSIGIADDAERIEFDGAGDISLLGANVGIGTTSPEGITSGVTSLSISDSGAKTTGDKTGVLAFKTDDASFTGTYSDGVAAEIYAISESSTGAAYGLGFLTSTITSSNRAERMRIDINGNVGIGTDDPSRKLTIKSAGANATQISLVDNDSTNEVFAVGQQSDGDGFLAVRQDDGTTTVLFDGSGDNYINGGNVGIGTDSPAERLQVKGGIGFQATNSTNRWSGYTWTDNTFRLNYNGAGADELILDSSGNLLIGKDNTTFANAGIALRGSVADFIRSENPAINVNRLSNNGDQIRFHQAGTLIGSIGSEGGDSLFIQGGTSSGSGLLMHGSGAKVLPLQNGATVNDTIDLGQDTRRFKDIWVSGNITLAGTVAASTNITSTGIITANHIIRSDAGHNTARIEAVYDDQNSTNPQYNGNILMWVSEPGITYDSGGIGVNVHPSGQYYGRAYNYGYSTYVQFKKSDGNIVFYNNQGTSGSAGASQTEMMRIEQAGNVRLAVNAGIGFGSTAAQHLLDDYEEGTWTPEIHSSGGAVSKSYSYRSGYYIKIGNAVYVRFGFRLSSRSGGGGTAEITGLPFTSKNYGGYQQPACTVNSQSLTTNPGGYVLYYTVDNNTKLQGRLMGNNGDVVLPISYYQNTSWCIGNFIYDVA